MKKSKCIQLVLISAALASCNKPEKDWDDNNKVHLRSDTSAPYTRVHHNGGMGMGIGTALLWYYAFRPYGNFRNGNYQRTGFFSGAINAKSNIGSNGLKGGVIRGGFGRGGYSSVSS